MVVHRPGTDPELLWLWRRPAAAAAIRPLAWELPYATGVALKSKKKKRSSHGGAVVNESKTRNHEVAGLIPWPCSVGWGSGITLSCGVGRRLGSDPALLWLWCRPAAVAPIRPLAWEPPYATGVALKSKKQKNKTKTKGDKKWVKSLRV